MTPTLGGLFGNNVVVGNTGLLLNNGMRLGSTSPYPTDVNYVGAGKIPILNNSPVVVLKDGKVAFVFGTPGGETIGQTEFQVLVNLIDFDMPVQQAIEAPRFVLDAKPNFYKPGAEITVQIENRVAGGNDCRAQGDGPQRQGAARVGQPRTHAGDPDRSQDRDDDGRRRSAAHGVRDGVLVVGRWSLVMLSYDTKIVTPAFSSASPRSRRRRERPSRTGTSRRPLPRAAAAPSPARATSAGSRRRIRARATG